MIEVRGLVKNHGALRVLDGVSLSVQRGEVAAVIGPSGGGKSTLLRCINGLETFEEGEVQVDQIRLQAGTARGEIGETLRELRRRVGMVFQQFNLFPHMSVLDNVLAGPRYALRQSRGRVRDRGAAAAGSSGPSGQTRRASPNNFPAASSSAWRSRGHWR